LKIERRRRLRFKDDERKKIKGEGLWCMVAGGNEEGGEVIFLLSSCLYIVWNL